MDYFSAFFHSRSRIGIGVLLALLFLLTAACSFTDLSEPEILSGESTIALKSSKDKQLRQEVDITIIAGLTVDADGNTVIPFAADPSTLLFYLRTGLPVLAPDGHQLTAGEFAAAQGTAEAKCLGSGTQVKLHLSGLIPNAVYRAWVLTFEAPGFDRTKPNPFEFLTGEGALGPNDRSRNTFRSSASGEGTIVRFIPDGPLSEYGDGASCMLSDIFEWHVFVALQQPGQPYGPEIGPPVFFPESAVEQFVFVFK